MNSFLLRFAGTSVPFEIEKIIVADSSKVFSKTSTIDLDSLCKISSQTKVRYSSKLKTNTERLENAADVNETSILGGLDDIVCKIEKWLSPATESISKKFNVPPVNGILLYGYFYSISLYFHM